LYSLYPLHLRVSVSVNSLLSIVVLLLSPPPSHRWAVCWIAYILEVGAVKRSLSELWRVNRTCSLGCLPLTPAIFSVDTFTTSSIHRMILRNHRSLSFGQIIGFYVMPVANSIIQFDLGYDHLHTLIILYLYFIYVILIILYLSIYYYAKRSS